MKSTKIVFSVLLCIAVVFMSSCFSYKSFDELAGVSGETTTIYEYKTTSYDSTTSVVVMPGVTEEEPLTENIPVPETEPAVTVPTETEPAVTVPTETEPAETVPAETQPPETVPSFTLPVEEELSSDRIEEEVKTTEASTENVPVYTTKQIIEAYEAALNKTRSYRDPMTATKTESFTANVRDAYPGGALTELLANNIVKLVGSQGQQTLNFTDGKAVDNEGNTVPALLPQNNAFSLPAEGVDSASLKEVDGKKHIRIVLVPETVKMGEVPKYNSGAIGYLDTNMLEFKIVTISRADITYPGSVIEAVVGSDGYLESVTYTIKMSTYAELSGMGISGYGTLEGQQIEKWEINM